MDFQQPTANYASMTAWLRAASSWYNTIESDIGHYQEILGEFINEQKEDSCLAS